MAKRILTREKIDRQLAGQSSSTTPFMKVCEGYYTNKKACYLVFFSLTGLFCLERQAFNRFSCLHQVLKTNLQIKRQSHLTCKKVR